MYILFCYIMFIKIIKFLQASESLLSLHFVKTMRCIKKCDKNMYFSAVALYNPIRPHEYQFI